MSGEDPLVDTVLDGAFRLTRVIYSGGMGTVYEAQQLRLSRRVAVKVMVPELAENAEALARFRREVEVTSRLAHPHVIQLFDYGTTPAGQPYLVMEFLEGEDLERRLERVGRLPLDAVVSIVKQVAAALVATHAKGIVHRNLKPANVFLTPLDGGADFAKIVDFGISKVRTAQTKLTRAFSMLGTPEYMSPEQATLRVDDVDHRSDQWAMGCMTWRMLSGQLPFQGSTLNELLESVVRREPPPLGRLVAGVPPEVERVIRRALAKAQGDRFPTLSAFARAFEAAASGIAPREAWATPPPRIEPNPAPPRSVLGPGPGPAPKPSAPARRRSRGWLTLTLVLAVAAGAALWYRAREAAEPTLDAGGARPEPRAPKRPRPRSRAAGEPGRE